MPTVKFHTLGCKANQYDTQSIRECFLEHGFREAPGRKKADIYLINTCTVTAIADQKSAKVIRSCINENSGAKVIVTGCMVQEDSRALAKIKGINFIISKSFFSEGISAFSAHTRAFLKVQDGCDNFCAYCKVPLVRGRSRSRPLEEIIQEAKVLVKNGFKEIVLTGICLGSYGKDLKKGDASKNGDAATFLKSDVRKVAASPLVKLIEELEQIEGLLRIRLSSIEAGDVSSGLIEKIKKSRKLCRHLHIPIQSGDNGILEKMNRQYTRESYLRLISRIKRIVPFISITTDIIVGFPGESEQGFKNTVKLLKEVVPLRTHIFPYSPRPGTKAYLLGNPVNPLIIRRRVEALKCITEKLAQSYRKKFLKKELDVLFEGDCRIYPGFLTGYSSNYLKVITRARPGIVNQLISLQAKGIAKDYLTA